MYIFQPPIRIPTEIHFRLPQRFRKKQRTPWSDPNRLGQEVD
jgi:gluconolactonase